MRPERADIAAPALVPGMDWIGPEPKAMERLTAKGPTLVHFFEVGESSGVRTLPYVSAWTRSYGPHGLSVIGVHSPRNALASATADLAAAIERLEVPFPVANDAERRLWHAYGCRGWPSLFLWARGGVLRWAHFGEGTYESTESEIRDALGADEEELPERFPPIRPCDAEGAAVRAPSAEAFPGGDLETPLTGGGKVKLHYAAGALYVSADGSGELGAVLDGSPLPAVDVSAPGVYEVANHAVHSEHRAELLADPGIRLWSVSYGAGVAG